MIIESHYEDLKTPTGPMRTYFYRPADDAATASAGRRWGGLLLYSEIFQQTGPIRRLAETYASEGFLVAVPEIYHEHEPPGTALGYDDTGKDKGNAYKHKTKLSTFDSDARTVLDTLRASSRCNGNLGVVGFCIGGHLAFRAAFQPDVRATTCFYPTDLHSGTLGEGKNADSLQRVKDIRGDLLMIWGRQDPHIPGEGRAKIHQALESSGIRFTWHEFNAEHAFMRDEGSRYDPAVARHCLDLSVGLFHRNLR